MAKKRFTLLDISAGVLALTALLAVGVSSYLWYTALQPRTPQQESIFGGSSEIEEFTVMLDSLITPFFTDMGVRERYITRDDPDEAAAGVSAVYNVRVPRNMSLTLINQRFTRMIESMDGYIIRAIETNKGKTLSVTVGADDTPAALIIIKRTLAPSTTNARIAVIIDDLGIKTLNYAQRLCALEQTVTLSVLPFQANTSNVIALCIETGTPYMMHMPMEPKGGDYSPGEGAIYGRDGTEDVRSKLGRAYRDVPGARGMNNHMGSKVTENRRIMEDVMEYLDENSYFFVDSRTSQNSLAYETARDVGIKTARIDGFLDVVDDQAAIEARIEHFADIARSKGIAIVIGHDHPNTIAALEAMLPELAAEGITFIPVTSAIR